MNNSNESPPSGAHQALYALVAEGMVWVAGITLLVLVSRLGGPVIAGQTAHTLWIIELVGVGVSFALPTIIQRGLASDGASRGLHLPSYKPVVFRFFVLSTLGLLLLPWLSGISLTWLSQRPELAPLVVGMLAARQGRELALATWKGLHRFRFLLGVQSAASVLAIGVAFWRIPIDPLTGTLWAYLSLLALPALSLVLLRSGDQAQAPAASRPGLATALWIGGFLSMVSPWSRVELHFLRDHPEAAGWMAAALWLSALTLRSAYLLNDSLLSQFVRLRAQGTPQALASAYRTCIRVMALVAIPLSCFGAAAVPWLLPQLFGTEFTTAVPAAAALLLGSITMIWSPHSALVTADGNPRFLWVSQLSTTAPFILAVALVVPRYGLGAAVALRLGGQLFSVLLGAWYVRNRLYLQTPWKSLRRHLLAALMCSTPALCLGLQQEGLTSRLLWGAGLAVYLIVLPSCRPFTCEDRERLAPLLIPFPPWLTNRLFPSKP